MDLKLIIAKNIAELRKANGLTQAKFAEKINYSDKAVSKWERGEAICDIVVLKRIADLFGVSVDYLLCETHTLREDKTRKSNHLIITLISCSMVYLIATIIYVTLKIALDGVRLETVFLYATPICMIVALVFNSLWGKPKFNFLILTVMLWSTILSFYMLWQYTLFFLIGVPLQIIIILSSRFKNIKIDPQLLKKIIRERDKNKQSDSRIHDNGISNGENSKEKKNADKVQRENNGEKKTVTK